MAISRVRVLTSSLCRVVVHQSRFSAAPAAPLPSFQERNLHYDRPSALRLRARRFSTHSKELDDINSKFAEAREEIELALESKDTVYFNEEAETARVAVQAVLGKYEALLAKLSPDEKGAVQRSMGLKMEQLKAELGQLKE